MTSWTYGWNVPGYLPEMEPVACETWTAARDAIVWELERLDCFKGEDAEADDAARWFASREPEDGACYAMVGRYVYWIEEA